MSGLVRHWVLRAPVQATPRHELPETYRLERLSGREALDIADWADTSPKSYPSWERLGGECVIGSVAGEAVFRAWQSANPVMISKLIPWIDSIDRSAYVFDVETLPHYRGRGYATVFLREILDRLVSAQIESTYARILPHNHSSMRTFHKAGFRNDALLGELVVAKRRVIWWRAR
jgi:GNAT superfamily N-acetyltransferase